jgi:creatinine amidohydrolase/Fe(II)-dependent formamide hydrolase-like protein
VPEKNISSFSRSPHAISHLTFPEIERTIARVPALILPLGGCEPYADFGALGIPSACVDTLAQAFSSKSGIMVAPTLTYGCSTPYSAFGGTAGIKPRTLANILCEIVRRWHRQGISMLVVIDGVFDNREPVGQALRRLEKSCPALKVAVLSLHSDERIRAFTALRQSGKELFRAEYGMVSMAAFIDPAQVREPERERSEKPLEPPERYRTWRKRGSDPDRFRKLSPTCSLSAIAPMYDADFGGELFGYILHLLDEIVAPFVKSHHS